MLLSHVLRLIATLFCSENVSFCLEQSRYFNFVKMKNSNSNEIYYLFAAHALEIALFLPPRVIIQTKMHNRKDWACDSSDVSLNYLKVPKKIKVFSSFSQTIISNKAASLWTDLYFNVFPYGLCHRKLKRTTLRINYCIINAAIKWNF